MHACNVMVKYGFVWASLLIWAPISVAQPDSDRRGDAQSEIDLRYEDHRKVTAPLAASMDRYEEFWDAVFAPAMEKQLSSVSPTGKPEIPHALRMQLVAELKHMHSTAQRALDQSRSYSRFKRDEAECQLWSDVIQYYLDGLHALTEEMSKADLPASAFAGLAMNQVFTGLIGVSSLHPAVMPCFLEKGQYAQPVIAIVREKAEELRGTKSP